MEKHPITELEANKLLVAPSILAADFSKLGEEIKRVEKAGADLIHLDIMDGHFVPNLTIGPPVVKSIRKTTSLIFDTHLMISEPLKYIEPFALAGADNITFHVECENDTDEVIDTIKSFGCSVGLSVRPKNGADLLIPFIDKIDLILIMTVEPGFGGQSFMHDMMPKVSEIREAINNSQHPVHLEVDGGIDSETVSIVTKAGANMMVAGTSVFRATDGTETIISNLHSAQQYIDW